MGAAEFIGVHSTKAVPAGAGKPAQRKLYWFVWRNEDAGQYYAQQLNPAFQGVGTPRALPANLFERAFSYEPTLLVMPISKLLPTDVEEKAARPQPGSAGQKQAPEPKAAAPKAPGPKASQPISKNEPEPSSASKRAVPKAPAQPLRAAAEDGERVPQPAHTDTKDILRSVLSNMNEEEQAAVYPRSGQKITVATFTPSPSQPGKPTAAPVPPAEPAPEPASHWEKDTPVALDDVLAPKQHKPLAGKGISAAERLDLNLRQDFERCMNQLRAGKKRDAVAQLERLLGTTEGIIPAHKHAFTEFGRDLRKSNMYMLAEQFFFKALELAPDDANAHFNLAKSYIKMNKYEDANRLLEKALAMDPQLNCAKELLKEVRPRMAKIRL